MVKDTHPILLMAPPAQAVDEAVGRGLGSTARVDVPLLSLLLTPSAGVCVASECGVDPSHCSSSEERCPRVEAGVKKQADEEALSIAITHTHTHTLPSHL